MFGDKVLMNSVSACKHCPLSHNTSNIICGICKMLRHPNLFQYLNSLSYFSIFGVDAKYKIDQNRLSVVYKELQKNIHPDVFHNKDAEICSSLVSEAYQTLKNDLSRAEYLLKFYKVDNNNKGMCYGNYSPEKLAKLYSIQEQIEEEKTIEKVKGVKKMIEDEIEKDKKEIENGFNNRNYIKVKNMLVNIRYNQAIINTINKKLNLL